MQGYKKELETLLKNRYYTFFVLLVAILGFGYSATHPALNVDTLAADLYVGSGQAMLRSGRFGMTIWSWLSGYGTHLYENSFTTSVLAVVMLIWAATNFCVLFQRASGGRISMSACTVFSACMVSYPLMNEIWGYQGANLIICGGFLLVSGALLLIEGQFRREKFRFSLSLAAVGFLTMVCAGYESVAAVYVFGVFALLFFQERSAPDWKKHLRQGLCYCLALVLGLALRIAIHKLILFTLHLTPGTNGATDILWLTAESKGAQLAYLVSSIVSQHFLAGALYFPVGMFVIAAVVLIVLMIVQFARKRAFSGLLVLGMLFSTEALSLLQGIASPYRACQVFAVCVAFVGLMAANRLRFKNIAAFALCFLCLHQSIYMSRLNVLNDMRYEEEIAMVEQIAAELNQGYDLDKPVIFVGEYQISDAIMSQITVSADSACYQAVNGFQETLHRLVPAYPNVPVEQTFPVTNVQSLIRWSTKAFRGQNQMGALLARCGCTVRTVDELYGGILESAESYAIEHEMPAYPSEGYIAELDQAIIVKLGEEYLLHES